LVEGESGFVGGEGDAAGGDGGDLIVAGDQGAILAAAEEEVGYAVWLVGGFDEHFFYSANVVAEGIVGFGADDFSGVQHGCSFVVRVRASKKKARAGG
jgi:hypothetical protein